MRQVSSVSGQNSENLLRQCDDLTLINELNTAVIQQKPLNEILALLSQSVAQNFQSNGVTVYLLGRDNNTLEMQPDTIPAKVIEIIESLLSIKMPRVIIRRNPGSYYFKALSSGEPLFLSDSESIKKLMSELTDNKSLQKIVSKIQNAIGIKSVIIFPLVFGNLSLGIMDISRKTAFSDIEIQRLQNIVLQVTEAILFHRSILEKETLLKELQATQLKLKKLSGLIPICSHCKKIRDDSGYWNQLEKYISEHTDAVFTHGICPDCLEKYYPEFVAKKKKS